MWAGEERRSIVIIDRAKPVTHGTIGHAQRFGNLSLLPAFCWSASARNRRASFQAVDAYFMPPF